MLWPGEDNYTRSRRVLGATQQGHTFSPRPLAYYVLECLPYRDSHECDATCYFLLTAQKENRG